MPTPYTIVLRNNRTGEATRIVGEFADKEWQRLATFAEESERLDRAAFLQGKTSFSIAIRWTDQGGFEPVELPADNEIADLLHRLRPFILDREPCYLPTVLGVVARQFDHPYIKNEIRKVRDSFTTRAAQESYQFSVDELVINSEAALRLWLNAFEYHRDPEKRALLKAINQVVPWDVTKAIFIMLLVDKVKAIFALARFIRSVENAPTNRKAKGV